MKQNITQPRPYKSQLTLAQRKEEYQRIMKKYHDRIPVVCERSPKSYSLPTATKIKYLIPRDLTLGQFMYIIRKQINLAPEQAIFMVVDNKILSATSLMSAIYEKNHDQDGFLYITYTGENTFGAGSPYTTSIITAFEIAGETTLLP